MKKQKIQITSDNLFIILYLFVRIILLNFFLFVMKENYDENLYYGGLNLFEAILFLFITLCVKYQISTGAIESGDFPINWLFICGAFLIIECGTSIFRDIFSVAIYLISMVILLKIALKKKKSIFRPNWPVMGLTTIATLVFLFLVYIPLIFPEFVIGDWMVAYISRPNPVFWISITYNNFINAAMMEEPMFRFFIIRKLDEFQVKPWIIILSQSVLFSIAHIGRGGNIYLFGGFALSVILGFSATYSKRINIAIFNHILFNVLLYSVQLYIISGV